MDLNDKDYPFYRTPLSWATICGHEDVVKALITYRRVDVNSRDCFGRTLLLQAILSGFEGIVKVLLETRSVNTNAMDNFGQTPLSQAANDKM